MMPLENAWVVFQKNFSFYLASLNFYYLLLSAPDLRKSLEVDKLHLNYQVQALFLVPLGQASNMFKQGQTTRPLGAETDVPGVQAGLSELQILDDCLARVTAAIDALNK